MRKSLPLIVPCLLVGFAVGYLIKPHSPSSLPAVHREPERVKLIMIFSPDGTEAHCLKPTFIFDSSEIDSERFESRRKQWSVVLSGGYSRPVTFYCDKVSFP